MRMIRGTTFGLCLTARIAMAGCGDMSADAFTYSRAVVCGGVASSLPSAALRMEEPEMAVDLQKAIQQHEDYVKVLKGLVKEVHVVPVNESYPDCVFVEDPVVVCGDTALLPILGHESRRGEVVAMKEMVQSLGLKVVEMTSPGLLDGGDVLFTGREFFIGCSTRTNNVGIAQLANAFPDYPVTSIPVKVLHLKSFLSMAGPELIAIGTSSDAHVAREIIEKKGQVQYKFFEVPDDIGANCLYLNGTIIHVSKESYPESYRRFQELETSAKKVEVDLSEFNKVDGCFTCSSVLIK